jgi:hypothetical protein
LIDGKTLRVFGFISSPEEKDSLSKSSLEIEGEEVGLQDLLAEDVEANEAMINCFLRTQGFS